MNLLEALAARMSADGEAINLSIDGQIARLSEHYNRYRRENPFRPGDLVVPTPGCGYRFDTAHIVLDVIPMHRAYNFTAAESTTSDHFGRRLDMRVAVMRGDKVAQFWVESHEFDHYTPPEQTPEAEPVQS